MNNSTDDVMKRDPGGPQRAVLDVSRFYGDLIVIIIYHVLT